MQDNLLIYAFKKLSHHIQTFAPAPSSSTPKANDNRKKDALPSISELVPEAFQGAYSYWQLPSLSNPNDKKQCETSNFVTLNPEQQRKIKEAIDAHDLLRVKTLLGPELRGDRAIGLYEHHYVTSHEAALAQLQPLSASGIASNPLGRTLLVDDPGKQLSLLDYALLKSEAARPKEQGFFFSLLDYLRLTLGKIVMQGIRSFKIIFYQIVMLFMLIYASGCSVGAENSQLGDLSGMRPKQVGSALKRAGYKPKSSQPTQGEWQTYTHKDGSKVDIHLPTGRVVRTEKPIYDSTGRRINKGKRLDANGERIPRSLPHDLYPAETFNPNDAFNPFKLLVVLPLLLLPGDTDSNWTTNHQP